jgi:primosomal protein N' (replication factor Y)
MHCSCFLQLLPSLNEGICSYCHRKVALPSICNYCHKGYLKTSGYGIERIGAILKRIFPEAKIDTWERHKFDSQIILSTSEILTYLYGAENFDNGFMLDIDAFLVRMNYDATFNAYLYLKALLRLFKDKLYVFTKNKDYYFFQYLNKPWRDFYEVELGLRRRLNLPPYGTVIKITLRAKNENLLFKKASDLYNILGKRYSEVHGPFKDEPFKLRDKFRYALIIKVKKGLAFRKAIKEELGTFRSSSVQLAVNIR